MENEIWSIMNKKDDWDHDKSSTADEIAGHFHSFFDWYDAITGKEVDHTLQAYNKWLTIKDDN
jgi:hypothetical protein